MASQACRLGLAAAGVQRACVVLPAAAASRRVARADLSPQPARRARVERTLPTGDPAGEYHHQCVRRGRCSAPRVPALPQCCEGCPLVHNLQGARTSDCKRRKQERPRCITHASVDVLSLAWQMRRIEGGDRADARSGSHSFDVCRGCGFEGFCVICAPCSAVHGAPGGDGDSTRWRRRSRLVLRCRSCCPASLSGVRALLTRCETSETEDVVATDDNMQETEENWVNNERSCVPRLS